MNYRRLPIMAFLTLSLIGCGQRRASLDSGTKTLDDNAIPVAVGGTFRFEQDKPYSDRLTASDADNDPLTYSVVVSPQHGTLSLANSGAFTFTPATSYVGLDSFVFVASDGQDRSLPVLVSLEMTNRPVVNAPSGTFTVVPETGSSFLIGGKARITWSIFDAVTCQLNGTAVANSDTALSPSLSVPINFILECSGAGGIRSFAQAIIPVSASPANSGPTNSGPTNTVTTNPAPTGIPDAYAYQQVLDLTQYGDVWVGATMTMGVDFYSRGSVPVNFEFGALPQGFTITDNICVVGLVPPNMSHCRLTVKWVRPTADKLDASWQIKISNQGVSGTPIVIALKAAAAGGAYPVPSCTGLAMTSGGGGITNSILGANFPQSPVILFGSMPVAVTGRNATSLSFTVPAPWSPTAGGAQVYLYDTSGQYICSAGTYLYQ